MSDFFEALPRLVQKKRKRLIIERDEHNVRITVIVVVAEIEPHSRHGPAIFHERHSLLKGHLLELLSGVVEQKVVGSIVGDENVRAAVEIIVGDAHSHALSDVSAKAPFFGDIFEGSISTVQKQLIRLALIAFRGAVIKRPGKWTKCFSLD